MSRLGRRGSVRRHWETKGVRGVVYGRLRECGLQVLSSNKEWMLREIRERLEVIRSRIELARDDINVFIEAVLLDDSGKPMEQGEIHRYMWSWVERKLKEGRRQLMITMGRQHGKSNQVAVAYPAWLIGRNVEERIKIVSNTDEYAKERVAAIQKILESEAYRLIFPWVKPDYAKWGERALRVKCARHDPPPTVQGIGISSGVTGSRASVIILDDICDRVNTLESATEREKVYKAVASDILKLADTDAQIIWIRTPWTEDDAAERMLETGEWEHLRMPVADDLEGIEVYENEKFIKRLPLWAPRWTKKALEKQKKMDAVEFDRAYRLRCRYIGSSTFPSFERCLTFGYTLSPEELGESTIFVGTDLSTRSRRGTRIVVGAVRPNGVCCVIDTESLPNPAELPEAFERINSTYHPMIFAVENDAQQDIVIQLIGKQTRLPIEGFLTGKSKFDPKEGLPALERAMREGKWQFCCPFKSENEIPPNSPWKLLIKEFRGHLLDAASEEDSVMATYKLFQCVNKYWMPPVKEVKPDMGMFSIWYNAFEEGEIEELDDPHSRLVGVPFNV